MSFEWDIVSFEWDIVSFEWDKVHAVVGCSTEFYTGQAEWDKMSAVFDSFSGTD